MSNQPIKLDEILYQSLQPWLDTNKPNDKFAPHSDKINPVFTNFEALYEFDYYRPLNAKMEYYQRVIMNATAHYCNAVVALINEDGNALRQKYWYDDTLKVKLPARFTDVINVIKDRYYFIEYINPRNVKFDGDPDKKTETYIMQLLKIALVKSYLEIQNQFKQLNSDPLLTEADIYDRYFNQALPENSFLKRNKIRVEKVSDLFTTPTATNKENEGSHSSFTYKKYATDSDKLTDLFNTLKTNNFITKDNPLAGFKRAFSGKEIANPVVWSGNTNEFYYFIHLLHNQYELLEPLKRNLWKVACKCFIKFDGTQFDQKKLKAATKPQLTADSIEDAIKIVM